MEPRNNPRPLASGSPFQRLAVFFLRIIFKLLYHQFAFTYDWVAAIVSAGHWESWVKAALQYIDGPHLLEIGFGPGHLQAELGKMGLQSFGLDESTQMSSIARRRLAKSGVAPRLVRGDACTLPFAPGSFDQVVMTFPAEFLLKPETFAEIRRVLVVGGRVIIIPVAWVTGSKPMERLAAWLNRITGEAPPWDERFIEPLKSIGFDVTWEMIGLPSSRLLVIRMVKTNQAL